MIAESAACGCRIVLQVITRPHCSRHQKVWIEAVEWEWLGPYGLGPCHSLQPERAPLGWAELPRSAIIRRHKSHLLIMIIKEGSKG